MWDDIYSSTFLSLYDDINLVRKISEIHNLFKWNPHQVVIKG